MRELTNFQRIISISHMKLILELARNIRHWDAHLRHRDIQRVQRLRRERERNRERFPRAMAAMCLRPGIERSGCSRKIVNHYMYAPDGPPLTMLN